MQLRHAAVSAAGLGLTGALLPASGASAAEPNRQVVVTEDVTYQSDVTGTAHCTVVARLDWVLGADGPDDNVLSATTEIRPTPGFDEGDCAFGDPFSMNAGVTLRWRNDEFRRSQTYSYTAEGDVVVTVSNRATPYNFYGDGIGASDVSSTHTAQFADCVANCDWSRTLTFSSK
jgi:hypothetical protein